MSTQAITPTPPTPKRGPAEQFTGVAWVTYMLMPGNPTDVVMGNVTFESGCRNRWHSHPAGQVLVVTAGQGYYQEKGQPAQLIQPGDTVNIAPGVLHWHGATANNFLTHYAINPNASQGIADWGAPVTDEEYQAAHA